MKKYSTAPSKNGHLSTTKLDSINGTSLTNPPPTITVPVPTPLNGYPVSQNDRYNQNPALGLYLKEIGEVPLLTLEEEEKLAARIKKGDKEAREHMIKANLRLVVKIARDYENYGLSLLDLISEGNIGLMKAVDRFDPSKGGKFSTYGSWWIKQAVKRALGNQSRTIRVPLNILDKVSKVKRVANKLQEFFNREPTDEEVAEEMDMTVRELHELRRASVTPSSLNVKLDGEDLATFAEITPDPQAPMPHERLDEHMVITLIKRHLRSLDPRELTILQHRFGLHGCAIRTLEEVGEKFGVTRERIRQIQNDALRELRKQLGREGVVEA
jgi:RNA polymerase primary sigma factor